MEETKQTVLSEGKTKRVISVSDDPNVVILEAKDDITAADCTKYDVIHNKAELATRTTSNVFRFLKDCGIPTAFLEEIGPTQILAKRCEMIQLEVVVRREAHGSYLRRNPNLEKGHVFRQLVLEFFLKTSNRQWQGMSIPKDDPLIIFDEGKSSMMLYLPDQPLSSQQNFAVLKDWPLNCQPHQLEDMGTYAKRTFLALEKAWQLLGRRLVDFKVEFGIGPDGELLLADVIDNDSWRVIEDGDYIDKQIYRDGGDLNEVTANYHHVRDLTELFSGHLF